MESPQREASFEHKKNIPTQKINVWKKCLKNQKFSFCVLEFDKFPFRVVRRSMAQSIARRLKQLLIDWTPSNSKGKWVQCYLPRQKNTIFAPKLPDIAARTSNGARTTCSDWDKVSLIDWVTCKGEEKLAVIFFERFRSMCPVHTCSRNLSLKDE